MGHWWAGLLRVRLLSQGPLGRIVTTGPFRVSLVFCNLAFGVNLYTQNKIL
jgi:hypothetical protein